MPGSISNLLTEPIRRELEHSIQRMMLATVAGLRETATATVPAIQETIMEGARRLKAMEELTGGLADQMYRLAKIFDPPMPPAPSSTLHGLLARYEKRTGTGRTPRPRNLAGSTKRRT